jgi:mRNA interferase RelE/StbE
VPAGAAADRRPSGFWRYPVGDYRIVAVIEDARFVVLVVTVGHRRDVYR